MPLRAAPLSRSPEFSLVSGTSILSHPHIDRKEVRSCEVSVLRVEWKEALAETRLFAIPPELRPWNNPDVCIVHQGYLGQENKTCSVHWPKLWRRGVRVAVGQPTAIGE